MLELSDDARVTAGVVLLTVVAVEAGGVSLLRLLLGREDATEFQTRSSRAGHAHAGVLVLLGLVCLLLTDATSLEGGARWLAGRGALVAAVLMPAGFFLGAAGRGRTTPRRVFVLVPVGAVVLAAGVVTLGVGLLRG